MACFRYSAMALAVILGLTSAAPSFARANDLTIKTGKGEELTIRNGLFGSKRRVVKDRLGNKYESSRGWFGSGKTEVSVLGNTLTKKNRLLGGSDITGSTILGDTVTTKRGIFGRRATTVDLSGVSSLVQGFISNKSQPPSDGSAFSPGTTGAAAPQFDFDSGLPADFGQPSR